MKWEFATAGRIVFGRGSVGDVGPIAAGLGQRALVVTGRDADRAARLLALLDERHLAYTVFPMSGEPTTDSVCAGSERARDEDCDFVIGFGGGSALDGAKAIAALATNGCQPYEFLEVVGKGKPLVNPPMPVIAIPTTAGTGSEVTRNAVLLASQEGVKVSLRHPLMLPRVALVDPELTHGLPPGITATTGLDALTQLIEPFVSGKANPLTDALCREGMQKAARSLRKACEHGDDAIAREDMSLASLFGGLALANAGLGAVHGFASVIGGAFPAPHGAVCAALLPWVIEANLHAGRARQPGAPWLARYDEIARLLTGAASAGADDAAAWLRELVEVLGVPSLRRYGIREDDFPMLVEKARVASSMRANPIVLSDEELQAVLAAAW